MTTVKMAVAVEVSGSNGGFPANAQHLWAIADGSSVGLKTRATVCAGNDHSLALTEDGKLFSFKHFNIARKTPQLPAGDSWERCTILNGTCCAITRYGRIYAWFACGESSGDAPEIDADDVWVSYALVDKDDGDHTCVYGITRKGRVWIQWHEERLMMASGEWRQRCQNWMECEDEDTIQLVAEMIQMSKDGRGWDVHNIMKLPELPENETFVSVSANNGRCVGLTNNGELKPFGAMAHGHGFLPPLLPGERWLAFSVGKRHSLALSSTRRLLAWGEGIAATNVPELPPGEEWAAFSAGRYHSLAMTKNGLVFSFGNATEVPRELRWEPEKPEAPPGCCAIC